MSLKLLISFLFLLATGHVLAACPEMSGSFFIELEDLYPESADWDPETCKIYISAMYNDSLVIYDPASKSTEVIALPNLNPHNATYLEYHMTGIDYDPGSGHVFVAANSATAFDSILSDQSGTLTTNYSNANYTGPNRIFIFDPKTERLLADVSLAPAQQEFQKKTGHLTNGFQDMAEILATGDSYSIGTFGNSIVKIANGTHQASLWYAPSHYNKTYGFGGIVSDGNKLIISDELTHGLVTFDTTQEEPSPTYVSLQGLPSNYTPPSADGLYLPSKYNGKVILWSDDYIGTSVYGSNDNWETAHFLGLVPNNDPVALPGDTTSDTFEVGNSIYVVTGFPQLVLPVESRKNWPFFDITEQVDSFVKNSKFCA